MGLKVGLLRAVNVGGRKLPMSQLAVLCGELGWAEVRTYIQSGNLIFRAAGKAETLEADLEAAISDRFGIEVPVIVRSVEIRSAFVEANPFAEAAKDDPSRLQLLVSKRPPNADAAEKLMERAQDGESVKAAGGALWIHYPGGMARSKLTPALIDRICGSPSTARNWRTVTTLKAMAEG
ncbi:MAG: DUF1697 domain-containing protein [Allosphingosinicella sp.]